MNEIGIMQGRLSPPIKDRLQAFPRSSWEDEFARARSCGLKAIEWLFEADRYEQNPIWTESGLERIRRNVVATSVQVRSLCADYFMLHPFFRVSEQERLTSITVLNRLIVNAASVGVKTILLPVLEVAEIRTEADSIQLLDSLSKPLSLAEAHGVRLGLETELPAADYLALVLKLDNPAVGVYYDTGNAAAKGYNTAADIRVLGRHLCGIHVKDRKLGGTSVLLGQGALDFSGLFRALAEVGYAGPLILQTAFGEDYLGTAREHLRFVKHYLVSSGAQPVSNGGKSE